MMKQTLTRSYTTWLTVAVAVLVAVTLIAAPAFAAGKSGTTLATYKTIDICKVDDTTWRYSGDIAVWNEGAVDTQGLVIVDTIQENLGSGFVPAFDCSNFTPTPTVILAGTTQLTALVFHYSCEQPALTDVGIRNSAQLTITNHSGSLGTPKGPNPKATWTGGDPPACPLEGGCGCTYTQGYWGSKPGVVWPAGYDRDAPFFLSGLTWQQILDGNANGNGYFILAHQYIAAILNQANGACVPTGVQDTLDLATDWLGLNTQGTDKIGTGKDAIPATGCYVAGSCGLQKDWGAVLDDYNNGTYPGSPGHCGDE